MKVAVVILTWNGAEMLRQFLPGILSCSEGEGIEVIVADNASSDETLSVLQKEFSSVRVIRMDQNYGFAGGYNRALEQVEAEYVVLLNSDVEVTPNWLQPLIHYMDAHLEVAACQPKLRSWRNKKCFEYAGAAGGFLDWYGYPYCRGRILGTVEEDLGQYDSISPVFWATGAALFIRLKDYREVGGLDSRFFAHMEEIDLCWRLRSRNRGIVCIPESVVYHVGAATLKESPRKTFLNFRNNLLMLYKNLPENELKSVMRVRCLLDYVAAVRFLLKFDFGNFSAVLKARKEFRKLQKDYLSCREENLSVAVLKNIPERTPHFLIWEYYVRGKKTYQYLKNSK
jgi:GT2 family glycosyltransferase